MKKLILIFNSVLCLMFLIKYRQLKKAHHFYLTNIESEDDKLNKMGMYKDKDGNIYPIEEAIE
ncbi:MULTISPECIES: hypothetical protein [Staphylococcus]|uniref:hypothetical protein n=1 Tax=Staphylococcus TaxID=1279 RepID=UPI00069D0832|nr:MULTISPECIES: hypothetical protein [Staphylococcus]MBE7342830.1 hypothetical protein [Staphylococcus haemolyticus]MCH4379319.1 hypothetical protein [Staphylococcus haemolyticus]MCH4381883.1 hypothetical protein [Staphylococcus haemolyticus]MCH4388335.1 hypothetical protein [Staphylococcus haemolyticus]MCH4390886.1 hypothetical protein [Staphylococcus haemolyticus]